MPQDKQSLAIEGIVRNVRALNYLIEDLFDVARISSGKLRLQFSEIRIQDVAREALSAIQPTLESKKLRISTDISEAIPPIMADSRRLHQVLMNLLNNAVKFTPAGGSIAVQVRRSGDRVEGIVSDTGKGIEREFLPFVFDRFRQENRHSKVNAPGLGLGLAIVREIVELHGGSIKRPAMEQTEARLSCSAYRCAEDTAGARLGRNGLPKAGRRSKTKCNGGRNNPWMSG
jgi:signal transduction histidine kinase